MQRIISAQNLRITLLLGGGVTPIAVRDFLEKTTIRAFHGSFSQKETFQNPIFELGKKYESEKEIIKNVISLFGK